MIQNQTEGAPRPLPIALKLRAGHTVVDAAAADRTGLRAAIQDSNRRARLEGLPDHLDPEIIDAEKVVALVDGLARLPREAQEPLAGKTLLLNYPDLMVGASAPTLPSTFRPPFGIEPVDVQGNVLLARAVVEIDCALARERAAEARARLRSAEEEVKTLEAQLPSASASPEKEHEALTALSAARLRRFALAQVWQQNARLWTTCPGADPGARKDLEEAAHAVAAYVVLRSSGMP